MFGLLIHKPPYRREWTVYRASPAFLPTGYVWRPICGVIRGGVI